MKTKNENVVTLLDNVAYEMKCLEVAKGEANKIKAYLIKSDVLCTPQTIREACNKQFKTIGSDFKQKELAKIAAFEKQFGKIASLDLDSEARINLTVKDFINDLFRGLPAISFLSANYFDYLDYSGAEITVLAEYNKAYFEKKHSIVVLPEHLEAIKCINDMFKKSGLPAHNFINKFFKFTENKTFEINLDLYDTDSKIRNFIANTEYLKKYEGIV